MIAYLPFLLIILGLILWFAPVNGKIQEAGRIIFFAGVLSLAFALSGKTVALLR